MSEDKSIVQEVIEFVEAVKRKEGVDVILKEAGDVVRKLWDIVGDDVLAFVPALFRRFVAKKLGLPG